MISQEQIQQVKTQNDIADVIGSYVELKRAGSSLKGLCPFHNEKSPSFHVNTHNQFFHCFGCGESGSVLDFIMKIEGMEFIPALRLLADKAGIMLIDNSSPEQIKKAKIIKQGKERVLELMHQVSLWYASQLHTREAEIARNYLKNRKIDDETVRRFGLGYSPDSFNKTAQWAFSKGYNYQDMIDAGLYIVPEGKAINQGYDRFRGRLMFPIWDETGKVIAFSARTLKDESAKYINSPETIVFNKSKVLYAFPQAKNGFRSHKFAILCEGQLDVIACHRAGFNNAVAPQGTAFTEDQARLLKRFVDKVSVAFDADNAGKKAADKSFEELLKAGIEMSVISMPEGEDPDGIFGKHGAQALADVFAKRYDYFDYKIASFNLQSFPTAADKTNAAEAIIEKVSLIQDSIARSFVIQKLAGLDIPEQAIRQFLKNSKKNNRQPDRPNPQNKGLNTLHLTKEERARISLIDLAIHHGFIAHKLTHELPESVFTSDVYGVLLGEIVGLTFQGEWKHIGRTLVDLHKNELPPQVLQAIAKSEFAHYDVEDETKREVLEKLADDCITTLIVSDLEMQEKRIWNLYKNEQDGDKKRQFYLQATEIMNKKKSYLRNFSPQK